MEKWIMEHPQAIRVITLGVVAFAAFNLYNAIRLHIKAGDLLGQYQKATSEALGG